VGLRTINHTSHEEQTSYRGESHTHKKFPQLSLVESYNY